MIRLKSNRSSRTLISGFVVALFLYLTVGFAWSLAIIGPLKETQSIPVREYRSLYYPDNDLKSKTDIWNVIVVCYNVKTFNNSLSNALARDGRHLHIIQHWNLL